MAVVTPITRYQGVTGKTQAYASTSAITLTSNEQGDDIHICYAALTGAMTINATLTKLAQFQKVFFHFTSDTTSRTVTFGTGFLLGTSLGMVGDTVLIPLSLDGTVECVYDGVALRIVEVRVQGRGTTTESPAYAAAIAITDQFARLHYFTPAQLTGALTVNATAVTKWVVGDEIIFHFSTDGTQRIVTFGTNILSSGTITIPANKTATARGWFNGTSICITNREISA